MNSTLKHSKCKIVLKRQGSMMAIIAKYINHNSTYDHTLKAPEKRLSGAPNLCLRLVLALSICLLLLCVVCLFMWLYVYSLVLVMLLSISLLYVRCWKRLGGAQNFCLQVFVADILIVVCLRYVSCTFKFLYSLKLVCIAMFIARRG